MCLTAFLVAMSQPSKGCCCWGVGWILCNLSTLGFGWVFFSLVSSVLCILLILVKASFLSLPKQNAVWMPGLSHTGNLHLMLQFSSLSCFKNLQSVVGRRMSLPMSNWVFLVFLFVSVFCIFATVKAFSLPKKMQFRHLLGIGMQYVVFFIVISFFLYLEPASNVFKSLRPAHLPVSNVLDLCFTLFFIFFSC